MVLIFALIAQLVHCHCDARAIVDDFNIRFHVWRIHESTTVAELRYTIEAKYKEFTSHKRSSRMVAAVAFCEMNDERLILALVEADEFRVPLLHHGCAKRLGIRSVPSLIRLANQKYVPPGIVNWGYSEMANAAEFAELSSAIASTLGTDMPPIAPGPNGLTDAWKEMLRKSPVLKQLRDLEK